MMISPDKRASLHRTLPNRLQNRLALLLPRAERFEQLNDLVALTLPHIVDADRAHLDVVFEQKVEKAQQPIELVVIGPTWELAIGNGGASQTLDRFCDPKKLQPAANRASRRYLQRGRQMAISPLDKVWLHGWVL